MGIKLPRPRWPGDVGDPSKPDPRGWIHGPRAVRPEIYGVMTVADVESQLRRDKMPAPFIRRMRVINLLSALTLRKIEDNMIAPFEVMDIHHVLNEQISQDAIIAMLENKNLALALETGNLQPLWVESKEKPMLRMGFEQRWIQRFITTPFDPICVMLAMRAKLMLDVVDELGHSYNLLKALGMGWIDFGEIPGEESGHPDDYIPPLLDAPIDDPDVPVEPVPDTPVSEPKPGDPDYVHPWDVVPGEPGHVPDVDSPSYIAPPLREPWDPGYGGVPGESIELPAGWDEGLFPGSPGYELMPGEEGYIYPRSPGGGYYGGDYGPGGDGAPGGPYGAGGDYASLLPPLPLGYGPGWLFAGRGFGVGWFGGGIDCCLDKDNPLLNVTIGYLTDAIKCGETLGLTVEQAHEDCEDDNYEWAITQGLGELSAETGKSVIYTAPPCAGPCETPTTITLTCGEEVIDTLEITIACCDCVDIEIGYTTDAMELSEEQTLQALGNVEGCTYEWEITSGGGSLSAESGIEVVYTAPASGHDCPGNPTISLSCEGEVCDTLNITINYDYAIEFAYGDPELEINQGLSLGISVTANGTPLTWAVSGTGFSLEHAETAGTGNVLHADETACGAATITITDCNGNVEIGFVRCTTGRWVQKSAACGMAGEEGSILIAVPWVYQLQAIKGNKKQWEQRTKNADISKIGCEDTVGTCEENIEEYCAEFPCLTCEGHCAQISGVRPIDCKGVNCRNECTRTWDAGNNCWKTNVSFVMFGSVVYRYYEWEC